MDSMAARTFSVDEANKLLPDVRRLVERIVDIVPQLPELHEAVKIAELKFRRPTAGEAEQEALAATVAALRSAEMSVAVALRSLEEMEVRLKDPRTGLIDFPAYRDGEMVELCWRLGEPTVANWHHVGEGFIGRRPL